MKKLIFLIALLNPSIIYACVCFQLEKKDIKNLIAEADFVVIGRAIKNIHPQPEFVQFLDSKLYGTEVLFEVDSIIKGHLPKDTIFINQYSQGSCSSSFDFEDRYMIFGYEIKEYRQVDSREKDGLVPYSKFEDGIMEIPDNVDFPYDFYQNLMNRYVTLSTNDCRTFNVASSLYHRLFE